MATVIGQVNFSWGNYQLAYDLLNQSTANNTSTVRLYGILNVSNSYVNWSSGSASVHTSGLQAIGTYYTQGSHTVITRDFTFQHDSNGNFSANIGASLSTTYQSGDCSGTLTLPQIKRYAITNSVSGSDIEGNFSVNFTKYVSSYKYKLRISIPYVAELEKIDYNTSGTTFNLSQSTIENLFSRYPNTNSFNLGFAIETWNSAGTSRLSAGNEKIITCKIINANPIFSDFEFEDINPTTLALTGNNQINVNGYSNIKATISTTNKATAQKGATISKYQFNIGQSSVEISYSEDNTVSSIINNSSNGIYNIYAIDSRNNSTLVTKIAEKTINYNLLYIDKQNTKIVRGSNYVGDNAILTLNGTFWNNSFGAVNNNIIVSYKFKKSSSSIWVDGTTTITPTINDDKFTFTGEIASDNQNTSWDLDSSYNVKIIVEDELSTTEYEMILNSAIPTMSLDKEGVGIMCAYDSSLGGTLQIKGVPYNLENTKLLCIATTTNKSARTGNFNVDTFNNVNILDSEKIENKSGTLIIKESGYYRISFKIRMNDGSGNCFGGVSINNASNDNNGIWLQNSNRLVINGSLILSLNSNDTIKMIHQGSSISGLGVANSTYWIEKLI